MTDSSFTIAGRPIARNPHAGILDTTEAYEPQAPWAAPGSHAPVSPWPRPAGGPAQQDGTAAGVWEPYQPQDGTGSR
jgi:hypothetical protein